MTERPPSLPPHELIENDARQAVGETGAAVWSALRGQSIFITGGSGFVGKWMLELMLMADRLFVLDLSIVVLTRDPESFSKLQPRLALAPPVRLHRGDVRNFVFPQGRFELVVNAALPVAPASQAGQHLENTAREGLLRVCEFAAAAQARRLLHVSSGAVYGAGVEQVSEQQPWKEAAPNEYTRAKRAAEAVCKASWPFEVVVARCFSFLGPYLEVQSGTAAAQFTAAAAKGADIVVAGTGEAVRSYQYPSDMARWLLTMLAAAPAGLALNVGSSESVSIRRLAELISGSSASGAAVRVLGQATQGLGGDIYVPDITLARSMLGLENRVVLGEAIRRTLAWHSAKLAETSA